MKNLAKMGTVTALSIGLLIGCSDAETSAAAPDMATVAGAASIGHADIQEAAVTSPDGRTVFTVAPAERALTYRVERDGEELLAPARLGLRFANAQRLDGVFQIVSVESGSHDETWEQPWGEDRLIRDHHNWSIVTVQHAESGAQMMVHVRAFDDGVAFRYEVPAQEGYGDLIITDEVTAFALPPEARAWWIPAREWNRYEYLYEETSVRDMPMVHTPVTVRAADGTHISIHEAALVDYSGMSIAPLRDGMREADLAPSSLGGKVHVTAPFKTPWRTIQIADNAAGLLDSRMILNLNEPNALGDVSWVEPGKYVGIWWAMHIRERTWGRDGVHGATTEETKRYMDFAAQFGFDGVLVEGWNIGWDGDWFHNGDVFSFTETYPDFDMAAVAAHGEEVGVRLIGHHETSGNLSNYERQMEDAFDLYEANGVRQVKTGYVADAGDLKWVDTDGIVRFDYHDGQRAVEHHLKVLKAAAKRKISINAHEPVKDTGLRRTYPNAISREGARGSEFDAWGVPPNAPEHTAILPFTRMLSGPMDYTPGIFNLRPSELPPVTAEMGRNSPESRLETTLMKQLAFYVVLYSPIQMVADLPRHYEAYPDAFQFILDVPADWERSVALAGEVGDYVAIARQRRGGNDWYLGALTDEAPRTLDLPLNFLGEGQYEATIYADGPEANYDTNPYDYQITTRLVTADDRMTLNLAPGGGAAISFTPVVEE